MADIDHTFAALRGDVRAIHTALAPLAGVKMTIVVTGVASAIAIAALLLGLLSYARIP